MKLHNPEAIGRSDQEPVVQFTPAKMAALGVCRGGKDVGGLWCGGMNGHHAADCLVRPDGAPVFGGGMR